MREYVYSLIDLDGVRSVLDLGCGKGYDLRRIGEMLGPDARLVGVDASEKAIEAATPEVGGRRREFFHAVTSYICVGRRKLSCPN